MKRIIIAAAAMFGAALGLYGAVRAQVIGARDQQALYVGVEASDVGRSVRFYSDIIGLRLVVRSAASQANLPAPRYAILSFSGTVDETSLIIRPTERPAVAASPVVGFKVADVAGIVAKAKAAGSVVLSEPHPAPREDSLIISVLKDPDGNQVEILQRR